MKIKNYLKNNWKKILFFLFICVSFFLTDKLIVNADTISDYSTRYYWCDCDASGDECTYTAFRNGEKNYVTLYGTVNSEIASIPTWESFTGFNNLINLELKKGVTYTFSVNLLAPNLADDGYDEFSDKNFQRRVNTSDFAYFNAGIINNVSASYQPTNCRYETGVRYCDYNIVVNYTVTASSNVSSFYLGTYTGDDRTLFFYQHYYTSVVRVSSISYYANTDNTIINQNQTIIDQNNQTNQELGDINDNLTNSDSSDATNEAGNFFSGFETDTFGLTSIITAPLDLIGSITSSSCTPLPLTLPFVDKSFNLPCMTTIYKNYFGDFLTIYQTITFGIVAYWVCVRIFALVKDFKNPDHDEIEVLDL